MNSAVLPLAELERHAQALMDAASPRAYTALVYLDANRNLDEAIREGRFAQPEAVTAMARNFIQNYIRHSGIAPASADTCWALTHMAAARPTVGLLQHLLLGLNALFRVELPRSLLQTFDGATLNAFEADFHRINDVIAGMYAQVWDWLVACYGLESFEQQVWGADATLFLPGHTGIPRPLDAVRRVWLYVQEGMGKQARKEAFAHATLHAGKDPELANRLSDMRARAQAMEIYRPQGWMQAAFQLLYQIECKSVQENCRNFQTLCLNSHQEATYVEN
jgi:hypothetical protein